VTIKVTCKCMLCDKPVEVEFVLPPTEDEKGGVAVRGLRHRIREGTRRRQPPY
jgi:hypothetical protein